MSDNLKMKLANDVQVHICEFLLAQHMKHELLVNVLCLVCMHKGLMVTLYNKWFD